MVPSAVTEIQLTTKKVGNPFFYLFGYGYEMYFVFIFAIETAT